MAQLLLIKTADTVLKTVGDIVGIFTDGHKFSVYEQTAFDILQIMGEREEVVTKLNAIRVPIERVYKAKSVLWSLERPEKKYVWKDIDEKWYFLEKRIKYIFSTSGLKVDDVAILETTNTGLQRDAVFKKIVVNPGEWDTVNTTEAVDLNTGVIKSG